MQRVFYYLLTINSITLLIFGYDKRQAKRQKFRISEKKLLVLTALGGWVGAIGGMEIFRHKTIKGNFLRKFRSITTIRIILVIMGFFIWQKG